MSYYTKISLKLEISNINKKIFFLFHYIKKSYFNMQILMSDERMKLSKFSHLRINWYILSLSLFMNESRILAKSYFKECLI